MPDNDALRWWLAGGLLVALAIIGYHRIRAHRSDDRLDRRQEGLFILLTLRPVAFVFLISLILYLWDPARMAWAAVPLPSWVRWSGMALVGATSALLIWTLHSLGGNLTDTVVTRRVHALVIHGPYRWVRHPFYDAVALLLLGVALVSANWFMLATGATVFTLLAVRARTEERMLVARFGADYRSYMARTNRFWPRLRTLVPPSAGPGGG
jgi:protein-S-isoprenylcysteine O-methyltransferase Ste14